MEEHLKQTRTGRIVIRPAYRRRSLLAAVGSAVTHTVASVCMLTGAMQLYAISLGTSDLMLGMLNSAITAGALFHLNGIKIMRRIGKRNSLVLWAGCLPAIIMSVQVFLPFAVHYQWLSTNLCLYILLAIMFARSVLDALGGAAWFPILQDNVPARITGRFFGTFRIYWQTSNLMMILLVAWFLGRNPAWWRFAAVFALGEFCFIIKIFFLARLKEKPLSPSADKNPNPIKVLAAAAKEPNTRHFLLYILTYNFAAYMCLPFQIKYLKTIGYSEGFIIAATSMIAGGAILSLRFWGFIADKFGNRSVFSLSHAGMTFVYIGWLLVGQNLFSSIFVFVLYATWSISQSANGIAQTRYMMHSVPETDQSNIVVINLFLFMSIAIAPLFSGVFLWVSSAFKFSSGAVSINNYHVLFVISAALMYIPHRMRKHFRKSKEASTIQVVTIVTQSIRTLFGVFISFPKKRNNKQQ